MHHPVQVIHPLLCLLLVNGPTGDLVFLIAVRHQFDHEREHAIPITVQVLSKKLNLALCQHAQ